jgi:hypothetical protein
MSIETQTGADVRAHFALSALPFTREIDPRDRLTLPVFDQPLAHLQRAGAAPELFPDEVTDALYEISRGNLRALDHLGLKTLELAAEQDRTEISATLVAAARKHLLL